MQVSAESDLFPTCELGRLQQHTLDHVERARRSDPEAEHCCRLDPGGRDELRHLISDGGYHLLRAAGL